MQLLDKGVFAARWSLGLATNWLRLLPDFIVIGAQKAGTTSLFRYLSQHPCVRPALKKEVRFFDRDFGRGIGWYRTYFPSVPYKSFFRRRYERAIVTGEASPDYLFYPAAARRAADVVPKARLIVLLRNPVDRAYSHYYHVLRRGFETLSFEDALEHEPKRLQSEREKLDANPRYFALGYLRYSYVSRGVYVDQLKDWLGHFPREQLLVLRSEDFFEAPEAALGKVEEFLNLPHWQPDHFPPYNEGRYPEMKSSTRDRLLDYFKPHNRRLYDFLGIDFAWNN